MNTAEESQPRDKLVREIVGMSDSYRSSPSRARALQQERPITSCPVQKVDKPITACSRRPSQSEGKNKMKQWAPWRVRKQRADTSCSANGVGQRRCLAFHRAHATGHCAGGLPGRAVGLQGSRFVSSCQFQTSRTLWFPFGLQVWSPLEREKLELG